MPSKPLTRDQVLRMHDECFEDLLRGRAMCSECRAIVEEEPAP